MRERILDLRGQRAEQQADIDALQQLADTLDDDARRAEVAWRRSDIALRTADYRAMERAARQSMALAERAGDPTLGLRAQTRLAIALGMLGDAAAGKALALDGLAAARAQGLRLVEARFLNALSVIASLLDDLVLGLEVARQSVLIERELGNPRNQAKMLCNLGSSLRCCGEQRRSPAMPGAGPAIAARRRRPCRGVLCTERTGHARAVAGRCGAGAAACAVGAGDRRRPRRTARSSAIVLLALGDAELALEHHAAAQAAFARSHAVALAIDHLYRHDAAAGLARVALARGDVAGALLLLQGLLAHLAAGGTLVGTASSALILLSLPPRAGPRRRPARGRVLAVAARRAAGPRGQHHRRHPAPQLPDQYPRAPRNRRGLGSAAGGGERTLTTLDWFCSERLLSHNLLVRIGSTGAGRATDSVPPTPEVTHCTRQRPLIGAPRTCR